MQKGIKFRIYPNKEQKNLIHQTLGCCRLIYNKGLALREEAYKDIDTDGLDINYDDGVSYESVCAEMRFELEDKPSWSYAQRAVIIFENEHDEKLNIEIPVSKWIWDNGKEEPYMLSVYKDLTISSLRNLSEFEVLLLRLSRAETAIIIDKEYDDDYIQPVKQPEASFS